jgi:hypothetical protein
MGDDGFDARMEELRQEKQRQREIDEAVEKEDAERKRELDDIRSRPLGGYGGGGGGRISKVLGWTVFIIVVLFVIFLLALWLFPNGNQ